MYISGNKVKNDPNFRLRILLLLLCGLIATATILYWRAEYIVSQEYIEFPIGASISSARPAQAAPGTGKIPKEYEDLYK